MNEDAPIPDFPWDIRREGRSWSREEWSARRDLVPDKIELSRGQLFWTDEDRLQMLALLLENLGVDRAVRLGDPQVWLEAVEALEAG